MSLGFWLVGQGGRVAVYGAGQLGTRCGEDTSTPLSASGYRHSSRGLSAAGGVSLGLSVQVSTKVMEIPGTADA